MRDVQKRESQHLRENPPVAIKPYIYTLNINNLIINDFNCTTLYDHLKKWVLAQPNRYVMEYKNDGILFSPHLKIRLNRDDRF